MALAVTLRLRSRGWDSCRYWGFPGSKPALHCLCRSLLVHHLHHFWVGFPPLSQASFRPAGLELACHIVGQLHGILAYV